MSFDPVPESWERDDPTITWTKSGIQEVETPDNDPRNRDVLTEKDLFEIVRIFPDGWEGEPVSPDEVDMEKLHSIAQDFGGMDGFLEALENSTETVECGESLDTIKTQYIEGELTLQEVEKKIDRVLEMEDT